MTHDYKNTKYIYHLTSMDNMESIFRIGLVPRILASCNDDIADQDIIDYRTTHNITSYIPFHFYAGTPFAGAVQKKFSNKQFVYIALMRVDARHNKFKILPYHPMSGYQKLFKPTILEYDEGIETIEWELMNNRDYTDTHAHSVCMAECLSPVNIPIVNLIEGKRVIFFTKNNDDNETLINIYRQVYPNNSFLPYVIINEKIFV